MSFSALSLAVLEIGLYNFFIVLLHQLALIINHSQFPFVLDKRCFDLLFAITASVAMCLR